MGTSVIYSAMFPLSLMNPIMSVNYPDMSMAKRKEEWENALNSTSRRIARSDLDIDDLPDIKGNDCLAESFGDFPAGTIPVVS